MPWTTPALKDVRKLTRDYVVSALGIKSIIPNSNLRIISDAMGGLGHSSLRYIDWLARQLLPDTAETEWLDRHGQIWLVNADGTTGRKSAAFATGTATATGINGIILAAGTLATYGDTDFQVSADTMLGSGPTTVVPIEALDPGAIGNVDSGETLALVTPISGVDSDLTVIELTGGTDTETDEQLRMRILQRIQKPPMGGSDEDYVTWALAVNGVTRAWCYPLEQGAGSVSVRFMCDDLRADNHGIPNGDDVKRVADYLDTQRPVAVKDFYVTAPIPYPYSLTISGLTPDTPDVRARIETALHDMEFERLQPGSTLYRSWVDEAISSVVGEESHELIFTTLVMPSNGYLPILGTITYA
jgi:uncharacterized phage protein gp47/JayE